MTTQQVSKPETVKTQAPAIQAQSAGTKVKKPWQTPRVIVGTVPLDTDGGGHTGSDNGNNS